LKKHLTESAARRAVLYFPALWPPAALREMILMVLMPADEQSNGEYIISTTKGPDNRKKEEEINHVINRIDRKERKERQTGIIGKWLFERSARPPRDGFVSFVFFVVKFYPYIFLRSMRFKKSSPRLCAKNNISLTENTVVTEGRTRQDSGRCRFAWRYCLS